MANVSSYSQLLKELEKVRDNVMKNEVAKKTKEVVQKNVKEIVYEAGDPLFYTRRNLANGSLGDINEMEHEYKDGVLEVTNEASYNTRYIGGGIDENSLAYNIEYGYGSKDEWWNEPRPFIEESREDLRNGEFKDAMIKGLKKEGINAK